MLVFFFTDIEGSTRLWEEHASVMMDVIARHDDILRRQVEAWGGKVIAHTGDGIGAAFEGGEPLTCALETQKHFAAEPWGEIGELRIRVGLHAGEAERHAGSYFGLAVSCTARVMSAAWGGQILLTPEVTGISDLPAKASILDLGEHLLKNVSAPLRILQFLHPDLRWQEFPPPRTLSGESIRRAVGKEGAHIAGLTPPAAVVALLSAVLVPTLQGDLSPDSPALVGNLGVLDDLGAIALSRFTAEFAARLQAAGQAGQAPMMSDVRQRLEGELLEWWEGADETAVALRADASQLLQAVHGVEATMAAASGEVRMALAQGLAALGGQFVEFRWTLAGVQDTLAEIRARQALQLALQREQLDLQRQQLVKTNLLLHRRRGGPALAELTVAAEGEEPLPADVPCPYKGLAAFEAQDAEFFFGREEVVAELMARLAGTRFLAVVGPSGSGKSSLVRAGLLPAVWDGALPGSEEWPTLVITPGAHPLEELAVRVALLNDYPASVLLREIEEDHRSLHLAVKQALAEQPASVKLLAVVDQFEEIFALCHDDAERRQFINALLYAVQAEDGRTIVVPTIRADFYGRCADYPQLAARMSDGLLVGPMSREELRAAIERPAAAVGLRPEPGLAEMILDDVAGEPGALPLLSHALLETFARRRGAELTLSGYAASGGVAGAIAQTADTVYGGLDPEQQALARSIFLRLTELGEEGAQDTRRRVSPGELVHRDEQAASVEAVLKTLADARLITTGEATVEVAHEALIREWPTLRRWLDEDREGLRIHRLLTEAAQEWSRLGREPGDLYRGARLAKAEEWAREHRSQLNELERAFLGASRALAEQTEREREAQRQRELKAARELATAERRRRNMLLALAAVLTLGTAIALSLAAYSFRQRRQALEAYSVSLAAHAQQALDQLDTATGLALAVAANDIDQPPMQSQRVLMHAAYSPGARQRFEVEKLFDAAEGPVSCLDIHPQGHEAILGLADGSLVLWDLKTAEEFHRLAGHTGRVNDVVYSPDGLLALSGADDALVILWDVSTGQEMRRFGGHSGVVRTVDISADGGLAVSGGFAGDSFENPGELILWDLGTGREIRRFEGHVSGVVDADLSPDGQTILASSGDAELFTGIGLTGEGAQTRVDIFDMMLWDVATGEVLRRFEGIEAFSLSISPNGATALVGSYYNEAASLLDLATGERIHTLELQPDAVRTVAFGPDGRTAISGSHDGSLVVWNTHTGEPIVRLRAHSAPVLDVGLTPDGRNALSSARDGAVIQWDLVDAAEVKRLRGHNQMVYDVAFTPDGKRAMSCSGAADPTRLGEGPMFSVRLWDLETGAQINSSEMPIGMFQVAISPDGRTALVSSPEPFVRVWDLESWREIGRLEGHEGWIPGIEFTPDGRRALSCSVDGTLILWDVRSGQAIHRLTTRGGWLWAMGMSPNGHTALSDSGETLGNTSMILWDLETGEQIRSLVRHDLTEGAGISGVAYMPDGRSALSSARDGYLIEWDLETGQEVRRLGRHSSLRTRVVVTPDGRLALTSGMDGTLMLWDLEPGELVRRWRAHGVIFDMALSPDGQTALVGSSDTDIVQWRLDNPSVDELAAWIEANRYVRDLTCEERETYRIEPLCEE